MRTKNQGKALFTDYIFIYPVLIGWIFLVGVAIDAYFRGEPMVFESIHFGKPLNGPAASRHTTIVTGTLLWHSITVGAHFLLKILTGKNFFNQTASGQSLVVLIGGGLCLMLVIMGPSPQILTFAFLLGIMALCSPFLLYDVGYLGEFQGDWINRLYRKLHGKMRKTRTPIDSGLKLKGSSEPVGPARQVAPRLTLADIFGNDDIKQRILTAAKQVLHQGKKTSEPRNGILLFGEPGNGKTFFAEAMAGELRLPLFKLTHADVASVYVGGRTTFIVAAFNQAISAAPCVFFIDEIDSFLVSREGANLSTVKEDQDVVNTLLTMTVDLRCHPVILMAATNHMDRLDGAGIREGRFDFKVEITPPDAAARIGLLTSGLKKNLPDLQVDKDLIASVARRWNGFSVKRIFAVTEELPSYLARRGDSKSTVSFEDFMGALRSIQGRRGVVPENVKPLCDLVLSPRTKDMIAQITGRLQDPQYTEIHGGTLPTGVLFSGPPGTGKTATAKAIAREIDWGFLPVTGADMARAPTLLEATYAKARELRPCLIFIDEADELLRSRDFSSGTEATNKLLTLMDGVNDRVKDVVWVAATNNPDMIDPALLRGGRFTEKIPFELPSPAQIDAYVANWLGERQVVLADRLSASEVAQTIGELSIANAEGVMQAALNAAIARRVHPIAVGRGDLERALQCVIG